MKKIKICYVISSLCEGPTYVLYNIVQYMDFDKFDVDIITMIPEKETTLIDDFRGLPIRIHQLAPERLLSPWMLGWTFKKTVMKINPDIVHVHCPRSRFLCPIIPKTYKKVETIHNYPNLPQVLYGKIKGTVVMKLSTLITSRMDLVIPCSESIGEKYTKMGIKNTPIPNGTSMPVWQYNLEEKKHLRRQLGLDENKLWFLFVGRFSEEKNPDMVIHAFENLPKDKYGLVMLGNGRMWHKLKSHESENIRMPGFIRHVQPYMKAADFFISASDSEGMPNTVLEALATGMPLLLSDISPHAEIFRKSSDFIGLLYDQKDYYSLYDAVNRISKFSLSVISESAHKVFIQNYTAKMMSERYQKEYMKLMEKE